jgi:hypothetical protein
MTEAEVENELEDLKAQLAALKEEHAKTRFGWLHSMRNIGLSLLGFCGASFFSVLTSHEKIGNPAELTKIYVAIAMLAFGVMLVSYGSRTIAEKIMKEAPRW